MSSCSNCKLESAVLCFVSMGFESSCKVLNRSIASVFSSDNVTLWLVTVSTSGQSVAVMGFFRFAATDDLEDIDEILDAISK